MTTAIKTNGIGQRIRDAYKQADMFIEDERPKANQLSFDE